MTTGPVNRHYRLAFRSPYFKPGMPFCVVWSQKAGCTALFKWYLSLVGELDDAQKYSGGSGAVIHRYEMEVFKVPRDRYIYHLAQHLQSRGLSYAFLRDPYERAFSSYLHIHNRSFLRLVREGSYTSGVNTRRKVIRYIYGNSRGDDIELPFSFLEYLEWLRERPEEVDDPHHKPQYSSIFRYPNTQFFAVEKMPEAMQDIERRHGLTRSPGLSLSSHHHVPKVVADKNALMQFIETRQQLCLANAAIPRLRRDAIEGEEAGRIIEEVFKKDIFYYDKFCRR